MAEGRVLGWDDQIENDSPDFILLPDGDYEFEVSSFERAWYAGGAKLPPCPQAVVFLRIESPEGTATVRNNFFLHSSVEGLICAFFTAIGLRKKGEPFAMNWNKVIGTRGRAKVGTRTYDGKQYNEIKRFYEPDESAAAPTYQAGRF